MIEQDAKHLFDFICNEAHMYPQRVAIEKNLSKKIKKGVYDKEKAKKLWLYWVEAAILRKYKTVKNHKLPLRWQIATICEEVFYEELIIT